MEPKKIWPSRIRYEAEHKQLKVWVPVQDYDAFKQATQARGTTLADAVRSLLNAYIEETEDGKN